MTHFGRICPPFPGHINLMAALGRELQRRGHSITFLQIPDLEPVVRSEGLNFWHIGQSTYKSGELGKSFAQLGKLSGLEALRYSVNFCQHVTAMICQDAPGAIQAAGIEALLVDQLEPGSETDSYLLHALRIKQSIRESGGVKRAADIVEEAVNSSHPALSLRA